MWKAEVPDEALGAFDGLVASLRNDLRPMLGPAVALQADILGVDVDDFQASNEAEEAPRYVGVTRQDVRRAEVLTDGETIYILVLRQKPRRSVRRDGAVVVVDAEPGTTLWLYAIGPHVDPPLVNGIRADLRQRFDIDLSHHYYQSDPFNELRNEGRECPADTTVEELRGAQLLAGRPIRTLATAIKASGGLLLGDLAKQLSAEDADAADELSGQLELAGLVANEVVVLCKRTKAQVMRVPSRDILEELAEKGLKCACGNPIREERVEEALTATDLGKKLLDGSHWFSILLTKELHDTGIPQDHILIEQQVGGEELDCLANISGELAFFELKDKEFSLGNAYSFGAKVGVIRPSHPVVITTEHVGGDAKEHFQRAEVAGGRSRARFVVEDGPNTVRYIEGIENLTSGIRELVSEIYSTDAAHVLNEVLPLATLNSIALLNALSKRGQEGGSGALARAEVTSGSPQVKEASFQGTTTPTR